MTCGTKMGQRYLKDPHHWAAPGVCGVTYLHLPIVLAGYAVGLIRQHHQPALVILDKGCLHHGVVILFGTWTLLGWTCTEDQVGSGQGSLAFPYPSTSHEYTIY